MARKGLLSVTVAAFAVGLALLAGAYYSWQAAPDEKKNAARLDPVALAQLLNTRYADLAGTPGGLEQWRGKVRVVNFWATWCPPCKKEMPLLSQQHQRWQDKGVVFVGLAVDAGDEGAAQVRAFAEQSPVSYPLLIGGQPALDLTRRLGNPAAALPYTLVLDRDGKVVMSRLGMLTEPMLQGLLERLSRP